MCEAVVEALADEDPSRWDVVDLRRLRAGDPAADALLAALEWVAPRGCWLVTREQEDVCPVVTLPAGMDFEGYLGTLGKKERHEIRRKVRRAEAAGPVGLEKSAKRRSTTWTPSSTFTRSAGARKASFRRPKAEPRAAASSRACSRIARRPGSSISAS